MVCDQQFNGLSSSADRFIKSNQQMSLSRSAGKFFQAIFQSKHLDNDDEDSAGYQSYFRRKLKVFEIRSFAHKEKICTIVQLPGMKETSITDSACKNQLVVVSVQYGPFNTYIPIRSTTIGKSRVAIDPIAMHTSWRSNCDIASVTRVFLEVTFLATRAWLRPVSRGNRHFTVGGGRLRQSGPRPKGRLIRQPALEVLTRSARTDSPRQVDRNKFRRSKAAAALGGGGGGF
ncbi:hypothetical protein F511_08135 [Dorcoceras hygrometricum]|uniref:Uncharacterized protein n=1 Tax=Dorcoceras hygrometricum TaxID=472368 RepID=A0A2Z7AXI8_9LAMI|nr:hypothetical protein F511_08135 [Dorcoceras hygrometricum]